MDATSPAGSGATSDTVPLRRLDESAAASFRYGSGLAEPTRVAVRDAAGWNALWARMTAGHQPTAAPAVDFGREMLLVAGMGRRPTGGHSVTIESVTRAGGELVVRVAEQRPGPRCGVTQALTAPADVVAIPRSADAVRWVVREVVTDC
ncbi:MAG TPA: protease complex subunit PrcB family protein [Longimicrobium sp.]|nr:protease complex subunit PrcB family protein [Longimicrobium sp.]